MGPDGATLTPFLFNGPLAPVGAGARTNATADGSVMTKLFFVESSRISRVSSGTVRAHRTTASRIATNKTNMKTTFTSKFLLLATASVLGLTHVASAQGGAAPAAPASPGLLGQTYVGLDLNYTDMDRTNTDFRGFDLRLNQNVREGLDVFLGYGYGNSENFLGSDLDRNTVDVGARYFVSMGTIKPFIEASAGWVWVDGPLGLDDDSFTWSGGAGVEFAVGNKFAVTPFARYKEATNLNGDVALFFPNAPSFRYDDDTFEFGVRANYWVTRQWALTAKLVRNDNKDMTYSVGAVYRF